MASSRFPAPMVRVFRGRRTFQKRISCVRSWRTRNRPHREISPFPRCHRVLPPVVISTFPLLSSRPSPCCHLDLPPVVISTYPLLSSRPQGEISTGSDLNKNTRFLASLRNDSGGIIQSFALTGTMRFLTPLRNDRRGDCHLDLPPLSSRPTPAVISTAGRDLKQGLE